MHYKIQRILLIFFLFAIFLSTIQIALSLPDTTTIYPNGDVSIQLSRSTGSYNYACVDETPPSDTDYVYIEATNYGDNDGWDLYSTNSPSLSSVTINSVKVSWRAKKSSGTGVIGTGHPRIRALSQSVTEGTEVVLTTTWTARSQTWNTNPQTSASWTLSEVNDLDVGVYLYALTPSGLSKFSYCSQVNVTITWTPLITKEWNTIETWSFSLQTRQWFNIESWDFNLLTRQWGMIEQWIFNLTTMKWNVIEYWNFKLKTIGWHIIESWNFILGEESFLILITFIIIVSGSIFFILLKATKKI